MVTPIYYAITPFPIQSDINNLTVDITMIHDLKQE